MWIELRIPDRELRDIAARGFAHLPSKQLGRGRDAWLKVDVPNTLDALGRALNVLVAMNVALFRRARMQGATIPRLYSSGVRYVREPFGREWWQLVTDNVRERSGDCEDLAGHRAAELIALDGEPARAEAIVTGRRMFHAIVVRGDGSLEDPSAALGMGHLSPAQRERALARF